MQAFARKLGALLAKDAYDLLKNPTMLVVCLMPVAFMALYRFMMGDLGLEPGTEAPGGFYDTFLLSTGLCMSIGMVGSMTLVSGIAEEKEKHTLRTLMLSNVSAGQFALSKGLVAAAFVAVVLVLCFAVCGSSPALLGPYLLAGLLGTAPVVLISLVLGLASRDQMTASLYAIPLLLVTLLPMFGTFGGVFQTLARFSPTGGMDALLGLWVNGGLTFAGAAEPLLVVAVWTLAGAALFKLLYRKLASDN